MQIHITFKHMDATEALKKHTEEKTAKLEKFANGPFNADWVLVVNAKEHAAELRVHGPNLDYFAHAKTSDMYVSIDEVVSKLETQLRRHKEIVKDHLHRKRD
ncbi:MAG TPA: ribosome-associated translation inhibitor RaiA [Oligoflexia bacterium]|nr:ribosome-associated translation inhibitor RaiA [Oligoflexia bacterium]